MKWKDENKETLRYLYAWYKMGKGQDIEQISKKKIIKNGKFPILTGTAFAVQCSTHWAAGNLPWKESKF